MYFTTVKWWDCGVRDWRLCKVLRQNHGALCPPWVLASKAQNVVNQIKSQKSQRQPWSSQGPETCFGNAAAFEVSPASQERNRGILSEERTY